MRTVPVSAERDYQVEIGVDWRVALNDWVEGRNKVVVITSENFEVKTDFPDRKSTRLNSSHMSESRMPSSA